MLGAVSAKQLNSLASTVLASLGEKRELRSARGSGISSRDKEFTLTRALRARRARPPEAPEKGSVKEHKVHPYIGCTFEE